MFFQKIEKTLKSFIFITAGVLFLSSWSFCAKREYFLIGLEKGITYYWPLKKPSAEADKNKKIQLHSGFDLQFYPSAGWGIQWENKSQPEGCYTLVNLIFKFQKFKSGGMWPYISVGFGFKLEEPLFRRITPKIGGGLKYRILKESAAFVVQLNAGAFLFLSENQHLSLCVGVEGGF